MHQELFDEVAIGPLTARNRIVFCAPTPAYGGTDEEANQPTAELAAYWGLLARGGVGLIVGEPQSVHRTSTPGPRVIENLSDEIVPRYRQVTEAVHAQGGRIVGSLWHAGLLGAPAYRNLPLWAPSAVRAPMGALVPAGGGGIAYALTAKDIRALVAAYAAAARRLREAGFDGIEVHAASGFLLAEFLSPAVNRREDEYGGSLENRCRIVVEIIDAVREAAGGRLAVGVRLGPDPFIEPGIRAEDLPAIAAQLVARTRVDYINVAPALFPDASFPQGAGAETAGAVRAAAGVPVIYNGLLTDPTNAETLVRDEGIDLVGMTRALLADMQLPQKMQAGELEGVRPCIACNQTCTGGGGGMLAMAAMPYCLFNPAPAEALAPARPRDGEGRRMLVIGAGLAGLEVARLARLRGFAVTLWERGREIGGQVPLAATPPQRALLGDAVAFYRRQLDAWGIDLRLGIEATADLIDQFSADVVVVATGSTPAMPSWYRSRNGGTPDGALTNVRAVLSGAVTLGRRVAIAMAETDHGYEALPLAEMLAERGHEVTVVAAAFEPSINQDFYTAEHAYRRMLRKGVRILPSTEVVGVEDGRAELRNVHTHAASSLEADSVVISQGGAAADRLYHELAARRKNVYLAGDSVAPRDMAGAIGDALRVMQQIATPVYA
jgi:2,4-dienoyl-CoA reductase (NADPH2)